MNIRGYLNLSASDYFPPAWAALVAGAFVFITLSLSFYLLFDHLSAYKNPEEQKFLIGVILMVPCYAAESFVSLVNPSISVDCEILRDCYEAFAMYCFGRYLVACLDQNGKGKTLGKVVGPHNEGRIKKCEELGYPYMAVVLNFSQTLTGMHVLPAQMGVASIVHLYVFPAKPYALMGDRCPGSVSVLGDYVSVDCPVDPEEVRDSERPTKLRLPQPDADIKSGMTIRESVRDVVIGGGGYIVDDVRFTVTQAVEPMEKGFTRFNEKLNKISRNIKKHEKDKKTKDDSCLSSSSTTRRVIRGIDDPLLNGSFSDNGGLKARKHNRRRSGYTSAESGGESSDQSQGIYEIHGRRWVTKD
ncbi:hypothetical protein ACLOJK_002381 [Asimina triloba]